jgi:protein-S-isoprenylcysteine O-methyltransferase Ste14
VVFLVSVAAMWLLSRVAPALDFELPFAAAIAALIAVPGLVVADAGVRVFRRQATTVNPFKPGAASSLVTDGVYRYTRNPMYLGLACATLGWGLYLQNFAALLFVIAFVAYMTHFQIKREERALQALFGGEYTRYSSTVRRWL